MMIPFIVFAILISGQALAQADLLPGPIGMRSAEFERLDDAVLGATDEPAVREVGEARYGKFLMGRSVDLSADGDLITGYQVRVDDEEACVALQDDLERAIGAPTDHGAGTRVDHSEWLMISYEIDFFRHEGGCDLEVAAR